jgi:hypothetical protein
MFLRNLRQFWLFVMLGAAAQAQTTTDAQALLTAIGADRIFDTMVAEMGKRIEAQVRPVVEKPQGKKSSPLAKSSGRISEA